MSGWSCVLGGGVNKQFTRHRQRAASSMTSQPPRPPPDAATPPSTPTAKQGFASTPATNYAPAAHQCSIGWQPSWVRESASSIGVDGGDIRLRLPSWRRTSGSISALLPSSRLSAFYAFSVSSVLPPPSLCREYCQSGWQPTWVQEEGAARASIAEASSGWQPTVWAANFAAVAATAADTHAEDERRTSSSRRSATQKLADSAGKAVRTLSSLTSNASLNADL